MSGGGVFGTGVSALLAAQRALQVTGHNISNVGTEGYSRQRVDLAARVPQVSGVGAIGGGVDVTGVSRIVDNFVNIRLGVQTSAEAHQRTLAEFSSQVNNLLGDAEAGLAPSLNQFFAAVHDVANDPTSTAARQQLIAEGNALVDRFAQLESRIADQRAIANGRVRAGVAEINQLAEGIADLNRAIVSARGRGAGADPNDLLDKRDELVRKLSEHLSVKTLEQSDGSMNVYVGKGQALVVGFESSNLTVQALKGETDDISIGYERGTGFVDVTAQLSGGRLGALLEVRETLLEPASNALGRIALSLTEVFNSVHRGNMDLNGELGEDFFSVSLPPAIPADGNTAIGQPALTVTDTGALVASDYQLRFDGSDWTLRRSSDGEVVGTAPEGGSLDFDGLSLDLAGVTGATVNDRFLLRPMQVASSMQVRINDPRAVAAALPVTAETVNSNTGTASVHALTILDIEDPQLRTPADIEFTGGNYVVGAQVVPLDPSGETTIEVNGLQVVLRGTPAEGDVIQIRNNTGGVGDNRGALALAALETERSMTGGTASFNESYSELVAGVGVQTRRAQINADVQSRMLAEAVAQRENVSGVNLDEEAANLLRYQQAYSAAAQVIATAGTMIDTLLATFR